MLEIDEEGVEAGVVSDVHDFRACDYLDAKGLCGAQLVSERHWTRRDYAYFADFVLRTQGVEGVFADGHIVDGDDQKKEKRAFLELIHLRLVAA